MQNLDNFGETLYRVFQEAQKSVFALCCDRFYRIGGHNIRLCFAGESLVPLLTPALAHLASPRHPAPSLTINLGESAATGIDLPPFPDVIRMSLPQNNMAGFHLHSERFNALLQSPQQILHMLDKVQNQATFWVSDARQLPLADGSAPLLTLLHWWLGAQGQQLVHGAAVGTDAGGALLVGKGGSGKSTTAMACLNAGLYYVGDDYCLVASDPKPTVYSLYSSGKIHFADLERFPRFQTSRTSVPYIDAEKALYFFAEQFSTQLVTHLPIKVILLPTIGAGQTTRLLPVSPASGLLAMAPSTVFQLVGEKAQTIQHLSRLVRQVPCYQLVLGADTIAIPEVISELLDRL